MSFLKEIPFYYLLTTSFQPSSCLLPFLGLGKVDTLVVAVVVVRVTARHWAAAVATVIGESALWGVVWVIMVVATTLVISAVFITLMTSLDLRRETRDIQFPIDYFRKDKAAQESKRCNRPKFSINFLPSFLRKTNLPRLAVCLEGILKWNYWRLFVFFYFSFMQLSSIWPVPNFPQYTVFYFTQKNRLSNVVDFSRGLQTSQKRTANNNC